MRSLPHPRWGPNGRSDVTSLTQTPGSGALRENRARLADRGLDALGDALPGEAHFLVQQGGLAVRHVAIGQPDAQDARHDAGVGERLEDRRPEPAGEDVLL